MAATNPIAGIQPHESTEFEIAELLVRILNLESPASQIDAGSPLYGDEGLGLDSIDILEVAVAISKKYGVDLRSDDPESKEIFSSLRSLARYVAERRTR